MTPTSITKPRKTRSALTNAHACQDTLIAQQKTQP